MAYLHCIWSLWYNIIFVPSIVAEKNVTTNLLIIFNVYKNKLNRQTRSRNLTGPKSLPRYGIPIWSLWPNIRFVPSIVAEINVTEILWDGRKDGRTEVKQYAPLRWSGGIQKRSKSSHLLQIPLKKRTPCLCLPKDH
jgi:hypothetical protein